MTTIPTWDTKRWIGGPRELDTLVLRDAGDQVEGLPVNADPVAFLG